MASPDLTPFIDLTLNDKDPQDLYEIAVALLQARLAGYTPREGNTEVLLMESFGLQIAELIFALNRVPNSVFEAIMKIQEVERDPGAPTVAMIEFEVSGPEGYTVPAGTAVRLEIDSDTEPIIFTTDNDLVVPVGNTTGLVSATGDRYSTDGNSAVSGTEVEVMDAVTYVEAANIDSIVTLGRNAESDESYFERAAQRQARLTETLVLPRHFTAAALENINVVRATTLDNYNPANDPDNNGPVGVDGGNVTVVVYGDGANVSAPNKAAIGIDLSSRCAANLNVFVADPTINVQNVTVTVVRDLNYTAAEVEDNVEAALAEFLSSANWDWRPVVRRNDLIKVIGNAVGVAYVDTLATPASDVVLSGVAPLVNLGTATVTVS